MNYTIQLNILCIIAFLEFFKNLIHLHFNVLSGYILIICTVMSVEEFSPKRKFALVFAVWNVSK